MTKPRPTKRASKQTPTKRSRTKATGPERSRFTSSEILEALDEAGKDFPALVTFSWRYGGGRLHAFADDKHWAIAIEEFTYGVTGPVDDFPLLVHRFGSRFRKRSRDWLAPIARGPCGVLCFDTDEDEPPFRTQRLHPDATDVRIRGKVVPMSHDLAHYRMLGIEQHFPPAILKAELHPYLAETYRERLFATDAELGIALPRVLRLDDWFHPADNAPSDSESFRQIATALERRDASLYTVRGGDTRWNQRPD